MALKSLTVDKKKQPALKSLVAALRKTDEKTKEPYHYVPAKNLSVKKADAGGYVVCSYGPNGENTVVMEDLSGLGEVAKSYFED